MTTARTANGETVLRLMAATVARDLDALAEMVHDDVALPAHPPWNGQSGLDTLREGLKKLGTGLSDYSGTILDLVEDGDRVALRRRISGRHTGELMGIAPTGKVIEAEEMMIMQFRGDRIARISSIPDRMTIAQQLGAVVR